MNISIKWKSTCLWLFSLSLALHYNCMELALGIRSNWMINHGIWHKNLFSKQSCRQLNEQIYWAGKQRNRSVLFDSPPGSGCCVWLRKEDSGKAVGYGVIIQRIRHSLPLTLLVEKGILGTGRALIIFSFGLSNFLLLFHSCMAITSKSPWERVLAAAPL